MGTCLIMEKGTTLCFIKIKEIKKQWDPSL